MDRYRLGTARVGEPGSEHYFGKTEHTFQKALNLYTIDIRATTSASSRASHQAPRQMRPANKPDDIVTVPKEEPLPSFGSVQDYSCSCNKIYNLSTSGVVKVIPALVSTIAVHPFELKTTVRGQFVRHVSKIHTQQ